MRRGTSWPREEHAGSDSSGMSNVALQTTESTLSHQKGSHYLVILGGERAALPCLLSTQQLQKQHRATWHQYAGPGGLYHAAGQMLLLHR